MDASSIYLRLFLGAKPFASSEMDLLAQRMDILHLLSRNPKDRYFTTRARVAAASFGNKVLFGMKYYTSLAENQRLAASAHEFAHIMDKDHKRWYMVFLSLVVSTALTLAVFLGTRSFLLGESAFAFGFLAIISMLSWIDAEGNRSQELQCDRVAAGYVDAEALIAAIAMGESMLSPKAKKGLYYRLGTNGYPTLEQRVRAIRGITRHAVLSATDSVTPGT
jgi:hypothetical protein